MGSPFGLFNYWYMANFNGTNNVSAAKSNPTPPDPIQAKIFMFFPLFLTIILAPFPSGSSRLLDS